MKQIELSKKGKYKGKYVALVDDEDFEYLNQFNWHVKIYKNVKYAAKHIGPKGVNITMQNLLLKIKGNEMIDHINMNGLDNQKLNLRKCSKYSNSLNRKGLNKTSKYKGVYQYSITIKDKTYRYFRAAITYNKKVIILGTSSNEIKMAKLYNEAAIKYHGEFANLNIIPE